MLYKTTTLKPQKIKEGLNNNLKGFSPQKKKLEDNNKPTKTYKKVGVNNKEKILCCFFFKK